MLETFGVSIDSETVYRAMLQHPDQDLQGLAGRLGRCVEEVRAALDELADLALVDSAAPGSGGYCALPPDQAIELLITREEQQLEDRRAQLADSRTSLPDLVHDYVSNRRRLLSSEVELLEDPRVVRSRLFQLSSDATTSICASFPGEGPCRARRCAPPGAWTRNRPPVVSAAGCWWPGPPSASPSGGATCRTSPDGGTRCAPTRPAAAVHHPRRDDRRDPRGARRHPRLRLRPPRPRTGRAGAGPVRRALGRAGCPSSRRAATAPTRP